MLRTNWKGSLAGEASHLTSTGTNAIDQTSTDESLMVLIKEKGAYCEEVVFLLCLMTSLTLSQDPEPR